MARIDSILESSLFSKNRTRNLLQEFVECRLEITNRPEIIITDLPLNYVFNSKGNFKKEICTHIRDAKMYINFEHNANDKVLQKLIFLFLVFSLNEYPDLDSWSDFLKSDKETKIQIIKNGIEDIWKNFQSKLIQNELIHDFNDNDPFNFF